MNVGTRKEEFDSQTADGQESLNRATIRNKRKVCVHVQNTHCFCTKEGLCYTISFSFCFFLCLSFSLVTYG